MHIHQLYGKMSRVGEEKKARLRFCVSPHKQLPTEHRPNQISAIFHTLLIGFWWYFRKRRISQQHTSIFKITLIGPGSASQQRASVMWHWGSSTRSPVAIIPLVEPIFPVMTQRWQEDSSSSKHVGYVSLHCCNWTGSFLLYLFNSPSIKLMANSQPISHTVSTENKRTTANNIITK